MAANGDKAVDADAWGRKLVEDLARESLKERRARRRWRIFFLLLFFCLLAFGISRCTTSVSELSGSGISQAPARSYVAAINLSGVIGAGDESVRGEVTVNAERTIRALRRAFDDDRATAVILRINSPGGSPVQAGIIVDEMRRLRRLNPDKPLHAVIEEMGLSGGYYIAAAADNVYVDKASLVGSIGVILQGFGLQEAMSKLGVEARTITAGRNKAFLNPFANLAPEQKAHAQAMLDQVHQQFIKVVKDGRGQRLKETPDMFSGLFWTGERSVELGLADGLGSVESVARDVLHTEQVVDFSEYSRWQSLFRQVGVSVFGGFWQQLQGQLEGGELKLR